MKNNLILIAIIAILVGGGAGFFAGMKYQQGKQPAFTRQFEGQGGRGGSGQLPGGAGNRNVGFRPVTGDIISADNGSITVKMPDGSSKIVLYSTATAINKAATAASSDLTVGQKVAVYGQNNPDGSVTAQNIQLNPIMREAQGGVPSGTSETNLTQ